MCDMELAKRAVTCKRWEWLPGMLAISANDVDDMQGRIHTVRGKMLYVAGWPERDDLGIAICDDCLPDLSDHATLGCVLALVRMAWGAPFAQASPSLPQPAPWVVYIHNASDRYFVGESEAAALIAALEAAP